MNNKNLDIIKQETSEYLKELDSGVVPNSLKKEYFEYVKNHIILVLLSLTKDYKNYAVDDVFNYIEPQTSRRISKV
jgi:hypothetical protein